jgi:hypothetical protein
LQWDVRDEIIELVGRLPLPLESLRSLLDGDSAIARLCVGTPNGESVLRERFKSLAIDEAAMGFGERPRSVVYELPAWGQDEGGASLEMFGMPRWDLHPLLGPGLEARHTHTHARAK